MFHIWTREDWERYPEGMRPPAVEVIRDFVNFLITILYRPDEEAKFVLDPQRVKELIGDDPGPVNWGDLKCFDVEQRGKVFIAKVDEASPDAHGLREYLERWLRIWGWEEVIVETEW